MVIVSLFFVHDWFILAFKISDLITFANISAKFPRGRFQSNNNNKAWKKKRKSGNYNHTFNHYVMNWMYVVWKVCGIMCALPANKSWFWSICGQETALIRSTFHHGNQPESLKWNLSEDLARAAAVTLMDPDSPEHTWGGGRRVSNMVPNCHMAFASTAAEVKTWRRSPLSRGRTRRDGRRL